MLRVDQSRVRRVSLVVPLSGSSFTASVLSGGDDLEILVIPSSS